MGHPTIYPTGVTVYNPEKCWNGFTIFQALEVGAVLMNMNGRENKVWKGVHKIYGKFRLVILLNENLKRNRPFCYTTIVYVYTD